MAFGGSLPMDGELQAIICQLLVHGPSPLAFVTDDSSPCMAFHWWNIIAWIPSPRKLVDSRSYVSHHLSETWILSFCPNL
ncbi:hypothetical protein NHX12_009192 [Muraenolepis orangiensis]|uniref:Uncharacterized protein n=1 Tax=Muraenolepis orangiensis TaxID=630683 RepID=A0A9Q0DMX1_9TELE|nr:hypothetical protein NHX12_009192 [Muraenolepis orangiensis]